jgi:hypothetical protein
MVWKRNRNLYTMLLLDQILNQRMEAPFLTGPPDGGSNGLPILSKTTIVSPSIISTPIVSETVKQIQRAESLAAGRRPATPEGETPLALSSFREPSLRLSLILIYH